MKLIVVVVEDDVPAAAFGPTAADAGTVMIAPQDGEGMRDVTAEGAAGVAVALAAGIRDFRGRCAFCADQEGAEIFVGC